MEILTYAIVLIAGFVFGLIIDRAIMKGKTVGRLRIDHSDPYESAQLFLELKGMTPDMIATNKIVSFEVINENYLSRD